MIQVAFFIFRAVGLLLKYLSIPVYSMISSFDFRSLGPLPVDLLLFEATADDFRVMLNWVTATEVNKLGFDVQRLDNPTGQWQSLGFVSGNYNSNSILQYTFQDQQPLDGINYYRLKQMDYDGKFEYLGPVAVEYNTTKQGISELAVSRAGNNVKVSLAGVNEGMIDIYDISGRFLQKASLGEYFLVPANSTMLVVRYSDGSFNATAKIATR